MFIFKMIVHVMKLLLLTLMDQRLAQNLDGKLNLTKILNFHVNFIDYDLRNIDKNIILIL